MSLRTEVTQRIEAERRLRASEQRFRDVAAAASDWIWETDAELRFTYFLERLLEVTGVDPQRVLGRTRFEVGAFAADDPAKDVAFLLSGGHLFGTDFVGRPEGWGKQQMEQYEANHYHQPSDEYDPSWNFAGAIEAYQRFSVSYGTNTMLLVMVYQRLGYAYLLKGDHEKAVKAFSAALDVPGALNKDQAMFEMGKLEEAQSRPEGALARYQDLLKSYPDSPFAGEATVRADAHRGTGGQTVLVPVRLAEHARFRLRDPAVDREFYSAQPERASAGAA